MMLFYGDGVNLASRLEQGAAPGGILISDIVQRSLDDPARLERDRAALHEARLPE